MFVRGLLPSSRGHRAGSRTRILLASGAWFVLNVHEIQCLPEFQGKGLGTAVLQHVIEQGARRALPVTLSVVPANPRARRLYERLGFEVTHVEPPFIRMRHKGLGEPPSVG